MRKHTWRIGSKGRKLKLKNVSVFLFLRLNVDKKKSKQKKQGYEEFLEQHQKLKDKFTELKNALEESIENPSAEDYDDTIDQLKSALTDLHQANEFLQD